MLIIEHMMPLCMTVSWIYTVALAVQAIVYEKEQRLKEVMKMMGLSNAVHWVAWFITSLAVMSITVSLLVVILKVNSLSFLFKGIFFLVCYVTLKSRLRPAREKLQRRCNSRLGCTVL